MTRQERAARREQRLKEALATKARELAQVQAQHRADARAQRTKRRVIVGTMADAAGLFVWDDPTLKGLFQTLALLRETPAPVAVLESLLSDVGSPPGTSVDGMAHAPQAAHGVGPCGAKWAVAQIGVSQ
jgi:hypothetical protein